MCKTNRSGKAAVLTPQQLETFFANLPIKYGLLAELMYLSAGRVKEISTLKVRNINFNDGSITIEKSSTKTKESRSVPIPRKRVVEDLKNWVQEHDLGADDYLFFTDSRNTSYRKGEKAISTRSVDNFFRKAFDWVGIVGGSTHSMRRSMATHLMEKHLTLKEIQDITGHKNLTSLQQYLDSDKQQTFQKYRALFDEE